jgi:hypothetical protein
MKNNWLVINSIMILMFLSLLIFFSISYFNFEKYFYILNLHIESKFIYYLYLVFFQIIIFTIGVPPTPILIFNLMLNSVSGFLISLLSLGISSFLIFKLSEFLVTTLNINNKVKKFNDKILIKNIYFKIFLSRFFIPFYFHNLIFGLSKVKLIYFIFLSLVVDSFILLSILISKVLI